MQYTFSIIPFIVAVILLMKGKKTSIAMLLATGLGIIINHMLAKTYFLPLFSLHTWFDNILISNINTIISIYLLGLLMYTITHSKVITCTENWFMHHIASPKCFLFSVPILGLLLSQDDYLSCFSTGTISGTLSTRFGFSKEQIAVIVNLTAIASCCVLPISSWAPVINGALENAGVSMEFNRLSMTYNLVPFLFLLSIAVLCYNAAKGKSFSKNKYNNTLCEYLPETNKGTLSLGCIILMLPISYMFFTKILHVTTPLIWSCIFCILVADILLYKNKLLTLSQILQAGKETIKEMTSLNLTLLCIWTFVQICNEHLGFGIFISTCLHYLHTPDFLVPASIFLLASLFSFLTGSSYGSFNLFIMLSCQLSCNFSQEYQFLTIGAAIAGSLLAAFSYSSDTSTLCSQSIGCRIEDIQKIQLPLAKRIVVWGTIGYILLAIGVQYPCTYIPILIYISACYTLCLLMPKFISTGRVCYTFLTNYKISLYRPVIYWTSRRLTKLKEYAKHCWKLILYKKPLYPLRILN